MAAVDINKLKDRARGVLSGFSTAQKVGMVAAVVAVMAGLLVFSKWAGKPTYAALYTDLAPADAATITEKLTSSGVTYQLADAGRTVMVPKQDLYELRLQMSAEGLPSGDTSGWSLLDEQGITTSEFRQRVDYQRALEGELAKTIEAIDAVEATTVHLVIPTDDVFAADDKKASASVLVRTASGKTLDPMQVEAIVNLVSSSVEGLTPDAVSVTDSEGHLLKAPGEDGGDAAMLDQNSRQTDAFETRLESSIKDMIQAVTGPGNVVVNVAADLDFSKRARVEERYTPAGPVDAEGNPTNLPAEESTSTETFTGNGTTVGGVLGPDVTVTPGADGTTNYEKQDAERRFAANKVTEETRDAPGEIRRLSVAVLVDGQSVDAAQLGVIQDAVGAAAGIDQNRNDTLTVQRMDFDQTAAEAAQQELEAAAAQKRRESTMDLVRTVGTVFVVALILLLAYRSMRKASRRLPTVVPVDLRELEEARASIGISAGSAIDGDDQLLAIAGGNQPSLAAGPIRTNELEPADLDEFMAPIPVSVEDLAREQVELEIADMIDREPEEVAQLLRGWLGDRRTTRR